MQQMFPIVYGQGVEFAYLCIKYTTCGTQALWCTYHKTWRHILQKDTYNVNSFSAQNLSVV